MTLADDNFRFAAPWSVFSCRRHIEDLTVKCFRD